MTRAFEGQFNLAEYYLDSRVNEGRGERPAVCVGDEIYNYQEVQLRANRVAAALRLRGLEPGGRVLMLLPDGIAFVDTWFGLLKAGGVFAMGNPLSPAQDLDYLLEYTQATAVVAHQSVVPRLLQVIDGHKACAIRLVDGPAGNGFESLAEAMAGSSDQLKNTVTQASDVAGWLFTSGTTGKPKGAVHAHGDFAFSTERYAKEVLGLRSSDVFLAVSRLFFGYATGTNLMFPFAVGGTAVLFPDKPTPERMVQHIEKHRVTVLTNVPAMIRQMVDHPGEADLSSVRICLSAGEALPPDLYRRWKARFESAEILDGIGSAEMFHIYITNRLGDVKLGSLGRLVPGYEAKIVGLDGTDAAVGDIGRLWVRGESASSGYFGDEEKSREVFRSDGWVVTADLFRCDAEGYFYYAGRGDDMLKVRGMFVSPLEIEDCLSTHPLVRECAVVGVDDGDGLTVPKAFVALRDAAAESEELMQELQEHAKSRLARYKFPRQVSFVSELPRNDRGKVMRRKLLEPSK